MLKRLLGLGIILFTLLLMPHQKGLAQTERLKVKEFSGRIMNIQVNPIVCPQCLVTCSNEDGIAEDDQVPLCFSIKQDECQGESGNLTPAMEIEVWLEPVGENKPVKLVMITTHNLYLPLKMNTSTRYVDLNLPNLVASMAEMEFNRKGIQTKFITTNVPALGDVIIGAAMHPLRGSDGPREVSDLSSDEKYGSNVVERVIVTPIGVRK